LIIVLHDELLQCSGSKSGAASSLVGKYFKSDSATAVFIIMFAQAILLEAPTMRNSNLLPVKAKGEVRLRSVVSFGKVGQHVDAEFP
jgi:hypothetical protein